MRTVKIGRHTVEVYDAIDELPIVRFHKYQKLLLIDAGIGGDISAFDSRMEKMRRYLMRGDTEKAARELENVRQSVYFIQNGISPEHRAFAVLVAKIDGRECGDLSDEGLEKVLEELRESPVKDMTARLDAVKKKIDGELMLYFPVVFNNSDIKEYYDILKKRTLAILRGIVEGKERPDESAEVDKLTTELLTYSKPKVFSGAESEEIQFDRQFENLCLALSEQLNVRPKEYTVLEFYNAFDFLRERARKAEIAQKRAK